MPNGGMLPCCHVCKWVEFSNNSEEVFCRHHQIKIRHSLFTFCSNLSGHLAFRFFVWKDRIKSREIYAWIQIGYQDPKYPGLPMYYHEYAILTSVKEYASWTEEQDTSTRRTLNQQLLEKLKRQEKRDDHPHE
jgi:hypothetical protein